jgi:glycogenin glucosyltransferase
MWYEVPKEKPKPQDKPKPIFPWEREHEMPKPTRVFADDSPPPPLPRLASPTAEDEPTLSPPLDTSELIEPIPFAPQANAWDNVQSIERYVRAVMDAQSRRSKPSTATQRSTEEVMSPEEGRGARGRRESLILTDFPTADDRPSLPVTPAPIRRPSFWGDERDAEGNLPAAEGVPDQADWVCPECGFVTSSPIAFYRPRPKSSAATSTAATKPQAHRSSDWPYAPPQLRFHRASSSDQSGISSTSTVVAPSTAAVTTSAKDLSALSLAVISPEDEAPTQGGAVLDVPAEAELSPIPERKLSPDIWQQLS